ncbi:MAG: LysR family substrate-binding domain-containing protein [Homoserinimonas sp.]
MPTNPTPFRVAIVPGVNPGKWTRAWADRRRTPIEVTPIGQADQLAALTEGRADVAFVRLPIDRANLNVIRLYEEVAVVVVPREHPISLYDSVTTADLAGETIRQEPVDAAIDLVVAGAGIMLLPQSIARQHTRRDLEVRPVTDAPVTEVAIAWLAEETTPDVEEFVGIVRGRTAASSRGASGEPQEAAPRKSAQQKPVQTPRRGR